MTPNDVDRLAEKLRNFILGMPMNTPPEVVVAASKLLSELRRNYTLSV